MPILRTNTEAGEYLNEKNRIIPNAHLTVCRASGGSSVCRYMCSVAKDYLSENQVFICVKNTPLKPTIDKEARTNAAWRAKADNCDGFGEMNEEKPNQAKAQEGEDIA